MVAIIAELINAIDENKAVFGYLLIVLTTKLWFLNSISYFDIMISYSDILNEYSKSNPLELDNDFLSSSCN